MKSWTVSNETFWVIFKHCVFSLPSEWHACCCSLVGVRKLYPSTPINLSLSEIHVNFSLKTKSFSQRSQQGTVTSLFLEGTDISNTDFNLIHCRRLQTWNCSAVLIWTKPLLSAEIGFLSSTKYQRRQVLKMLIITKELLAVILWLILLDFKLAFGITINDFQVKVHQLIFIESSAFFRYFCYLRFFVILRFFFYGFRIIL